MNAASAKQSTKVHRTNYKTHSIELFFFEKIHICYIRALYKSYNPLRTTVRIMYLNACIIPPQYLKMTCATA